MALLRETPDDKMPLGAGSLTGRTDGKDPARQYPHLCEGPTHPCGSLCETAGNRRDQNAY